MSLWVVQRWDRGKIWVDVKAPESDGLWSAATAAEAFHQAILRHMVEKQYISTDRAVQATSYRVLPWLGGAVFNVSINVDAVENMPRGAAA